MSKLIAFILSLTGMAACFGQNSYTATFIKGPSSLAVYGLSWISDDGRFGFGGGLNNPPFTIQCFTYKDGVSTVLPTPGFYCTGLAASPDLYVLQLAQPSTNSASVTSLTISLVAYKNGTFNLLSLPDGVTLNSINKVNKNGQIAATFNCPNAVVPLPCAYLFSVDGTFKRLPDLGGVSGATALNDNGDVAGYVVAPGGDSYLGRHAVVWPHTGGMTDLTTLTSMKLGTPAAINSKGQIAGSSPYSLGLNDSHAGPGFFYDGAGNFAPIQVSGSSSIAPISLNDKGEIVGTYRTPAGIGLDYPFYYFNGTAKDLNAAIANLPVDMYLEGPSYINNAGQILVAAVFAKQPIGAIDNGTAPGQYLLSPSNAAVLPVVGSVKNAASHLAGVASSTWIEIEGQNLSTTTRPWASSDFSGTKLPASLDGVSVKINGLPAYIDSVSPVKINILAPDDPAIGPVLVQVTSPQGVSAPFSVTKSDVLPALLNSQGSASSVNTPGQVMAAHADGTPVGDPDTYNCACTPALAGETISLFGTGFGATKTPVPAGEMVSTPVELMNPVSVTIGGEAATVTYAGRTSSGLDQINVIVPDGLPLGQALVVATVKGLDTPGHLYTVIGPWN